jgi:TonB family protein
VVVVGKLHRLSGDSAIAPSDAVVQAMAGKPLAVAIVKLCLGADGKVESTKLVKSSGVAAYDDQLQAAIKAGWAFEPFQIDGAAAAVCTTASIKAP